MTLTVVLGIRPDVIRASIILKKLHEELKTNFEFIWSGQHYSNNMKDVFFQQLSVPSPTSELKIDTSSDASTSGTIIKELSQHLTRTNPKGVVFLGDTNTVLGSIAAAMLNIPIIHIEGCMRSYDWRMPEEKNRTIIDHISDKIYCYLDEYKLQGLSEGLRSENIIVTGNPIVDVINQNFFSGKVRMNTDELNQYFKSLEIKKDNYFLITCHRRENIMNYASLKNIIRLISNLKKKTIFVAGYKTQLMLKEFSIDIPDLVTIIDPIGYREILELSYNSLGILSDSGTLIEESCILGIPSIQMRKSTERPQVYDVGSSIKFDPTLIYSDDELRAKIALMQGITKFSWKHPFGDGNSSEIIAKNLLDGYESDKFQGHEPDFSAINVLRSYK
jgi:UDP-N-acetylglucosamine 2-epimerase (non-hydrolysing)